MKKALFLAILVAIVALSFVGYKWVTAQSYYGTPTVWTTSATNVTDYGATLNGQISTGNNYTTYYFDYGMSGNFGSRTPDQTLNYSGSNTNVSYSLNSLNRDTTYYYRLVAVSSGGTTYGSTITFTTNGYYNNNNYYNNSVTTSAAQNITGASATLWGYVQATDYTQTAWFEYGTNSGSLNMTSQSVTIQTANYYNSSNLKSDFWVTVNNLTPNQTYYFKAVIRNNNGTYYGQVLNFMTNSSYYNYQYPYYNNYQYQTYPQETVKYVYVDRYVDSGVNTAYNNTMPAYTYGTTYVAGNYPYGYVNPYQNPNVYYSNSGVPLQASVLGATTGTNLAVIGLFLLIVLVGVMIAVSVRRN